MSTIVLFSLKNEEQHLRLKALATSAGLSVSAFLRAMVGVYSKHLATDQPPPSPGADPELDTIAVGIKQLTTASLDTTILNKATAARGHIEHCDRLLVELKQLRAQFKKAAKAKEAF